MKRKLRLMLSGAVLMVCGNGWKSLPGEQTIDFKESDMEAQAAEKVKFAPHPGKILYRVMWNHTVEAKPADEVPDNIKFIYYDANQRVTSDLGAATTRVPIVEIVTSSFDAEGKLADPAKAVRFSITQYGLHHHELRHTTASAPPLRP